MFGKQQTPSIDVARIRPTSKLSLKMSCLVACNNNIEEAERLYNFMADGLDALPDFDPVKPSTFEQIRGGANELFGWIGAHKDDIMQGVQFFQALRGRGVPVPPVAAPPTDIPPLPKP